MSNCTLERDHVFDWFLIIVKKIGDKVRSFDWEYSHFPENKERNWEQTN